MGCAYILAKDGEFVHTYSLNKLDKLTKNGWKMIFFIDGWNISITNKTKR